MANTSQRIYTAYLLRLAAAVRVYIAHSQVVLSFLRLLYGDQSLPACLECMYFFKSLLDGVETRFRLTV